MIIIVGLGNIGAGYKKTYHNVGFMVVDKLAKLLSVKFSIKECKAKVARGDGFVLAKPQTYMNLSGSSVSELAKKYNVRADEIVIVYDDTDIEKSKVRVRATGSAGGHNGLKDIIAKMNTNDITRIRVGIGKNEEKPLKDYVLSKMSYEDKNLILPIVDKCADALIKFIKEPDIERLNRECHN